jgi:hypothetical protein
VDPLVIARAMGELVDARLIEQGPGRGADLLPDVLRQIAQRHDVVGHVG